MHMRSCSTSLILRKCKIKARLYHWTSTKMAIMGKKGGRREVEGGKETGLGFPKQMTQAQSGWDSSATPSTVDPQCSWIPYLQIRLLAPVYS